jgi:hypothetical protein
LVAQADCELYRNVHNALCGQVIAAFPIAHIKTLEHPDFDFGNVTVHEIMDHLWIEYARISPTEFEANQPNLKPTSKA